jgi:hypothetical protein
MSVSFKTPSSLSIQETPPSWRLGNPVVLSPQFSAVFGFSADIYGHNSLHLRRKRKNLASMVLQGM